MNEADPGLLKWIGSVVVTALSAAVAWVWKRADGAATKTELDKHIESTDARFDKMMEHLRTEGDKFRETARELYAAAESDRKQHYSAISEVKDRIHQSRNDLMMEIGRLKQ